jgi:hypothetical protein
LVAKTIIDINYQKYCHEKTHNIRFLFIVIDLLMGM